MKKKDLINIIKILEDKLVSKTQANKGDEGTKYVVCLLYTSDAADERSSVDLGGRRIIKKKKKEEKAVRHSDSKQ